MKKKTGRLLYLALALCAACAESAAAGPGLTAAPALNAPIGARSAALGQAFTAVPGDAESLNYNPGALAFAPGSAVSASYLRGFGGISQSFIAAPLKFKDLVLTPGYMYFSGGDMNLNLSDGTKGKVTAEADGTVYVSAAYLLDGRLGLGATAKRTRVELAETASASAMNYDLGALYALGGGFTAGASYMNTGQGLKFEKKGDPAPAVKRLGAAYKLKFEQPHLFDPGSEALSCDLMVTADRIDAYRDGTYYQAGAELTTQLIGDFDVSLRIGYLFDRPAEGLTLGFGLREGRMALAYYFGPSKEINARQQFSLTYMFY